jgi:hypothetical protein
VSADKGLPRRVAGRESKSHAAVIAAYREGLGLAAIAVIASHAGIRVAAPMGGEPAALAPGDEVVSNWWCRRAEDAARVVALVTARLRIRESKDRFTTTSFDSPAGNSAALLLAGEAIAAAAKQCNVTICSDEEISAAAMAALARVEEEIKNLQQVGGMKAVNRSYRIYRTDASTRGEKVLPYGQWMRKYKQNLVRELAAALRYI